MSTFGARFEQLTEEALHSMDSYQLEEHRRTAWLADADADYIDKVDVNMSDAHFEEGWIAHGDVGMPGTVTGGMGVKDPKMRSLHNRKAFLEKCIELGGSALPKGEVRTLTEKEDAEDCVFLDDDEIRGRDMTLAEKTKRMVMVKNVYGPHDVIAKKQELEEIKRIMALPREERMEILAADTNAAVTDLGEKIEENHHELVEQVAGLATKEDIQMLASGEMDRPEGMTDDNWQHLLSTKIKQLQQLKKPFDEKKKEEVAKAKAEKANVELATLALQDPAKAQLHVQALAAKKQMDIDAKMVISLKKVADAALVKSAANPDCYDLSIESLKTSLDHKKLLLKMCRNQIACSSEEEWEDESKLQGEIAQLEANLEKQMKAKVDAEAKRANAIAARKARIEQLQQEQAELVKQNTIEDERVSKLEKKEKKDKKEKKTKRAKIE